MWIASPTVQVVQVTVTRSDNFQVFDKRLKNQITIIFNKTGLCACLPLQVDYVKENTDIKKHQDSLN